ncbi:MAG: PDZ domain-containing protein [Chloracidobacterium sp.]|nr:PDZ domain-containing protein [Chloracidobacterium sp.]MDW8218711.1 PDZ domain-containing protein [Acidobacteriota bacterium]
MLRCFHCLLLGLLLAAVMTVLSQAQETTRPLLARTPTANRTHIVFAFAGDLWRVPRSGGEAVQLTNHPGVEADPIFSPDGRLIAFTGQYDGNTDVYVVPATGGIPQRLTYHPDVDRVVGWTPDGRRVLFASARLSESGRTQRLFTVDKNGGPAEPLPLPMATYGSFSPDGSKLVYEPLPRAFAAWKRYRGGRASYLWVAELADSSVTKIPRTDANDFNPMWIGKTIYFLSDRNGPVTLFAYDPTTKKVTQVLKHDGLDIKSASAAVGGDEAIVYEQFGGLHVFDVKTGKHAPVNITLNGDISSIRPRFEKVGTRITDAAVSPTGMRVAFEARGEILTVPAEKGTIRNLTATPGAAERNPAWSPDGQWVAYFSDVSGEYELHLREQTGVGELKTIKLEPSFYYSPTWSPDSKKIAFTDKRLNFWLADVETGTVVKFDTAQRTGGAGFRLRAPAWSPDSQWLAYTKPMRSAYSAAFVYSLESKQVTQITDAASDITGAVFDRNGKYLYLLSSTNIGPALNGFDMSSYAHRNDTVRSVHAAVLRKTDPSPAAPESDDEKVGEEKKSGDGTAAGGGTGRPGDKPKETPKVVIDFDGLSQRIVALPIPARAFVGFDVGKSNTLYLYESSGGGPGGGPSTAGLIVHKFDVEKRKLEKILEGVARFQPTANGEKCLYQQGQNWFIASLSAPIKPGEGKLRTEEMEVKVEPRLEWAQMYREVWRLERDFFYDPTYHGLDLQATARKYEPYLKAVMHRADLNYLFEEMLGELSVGHLYVRGGDLPEIRRVSGGLLGADYTVENGRYRIAKIYEGENWNPQLRAPLTQPGVNVNVGDYILAVNGEEVTAAEDIHRYFEGTADKQIVLKVSPTPDGSNARTVTVVPTASESSLRNLAWIEGNRRRVAELSGGRLAYLWLPDTAAGGYTNFNRYFFSQLDKEGAVVDERFNGGGQAADYIIDYLRKPLLSYWAVRDGEDFRTPFGTLPGPKVMIINEYAGSGGDLMPWMFRRLGIGPLVGKRTWGGLVGIGGYPALMDGGTVTAPHFAFYSPEGKWEIENHGVAPDIEVELDPQAWRNGRDTQLERAVAVAMETLTKNPPPAKPKRPAYPNYHPRK